MIVFFLIKKKLNKGLEILSYIYMNIYHTLRRKNNASKFFIEENL